MTKDFIMIIDYGSGNLRSAAKAFEHVIADAGLNLDVKISSDPDDIRAAQRLVLPGQGAFKDCMQGLSSADGMIQALEDEVIQNGKPFLGICVGMQLMADQGLEHEVTEGLGWVPGKVVSLDIGERGLKIPHMGWNVLEIPEGDQTHFVLCSAKSSDQTDNHYYFVHSFMFECEEKDHCLGLCEYGKKFPAVVGRDNMIGVQFHPEKSQQAGLRLLKNFVNWAP